jgi:hypothetical protein
MAHTELFNFNSAEFEPGALHYALVDAIGSNFVGVSTGPFGVIAVYLDLPTQQEIDTAEQTITEHDPVHISSNKLEIACDGIDKAIISIFAPKQEANPVTIDVNGQQELINLTENGHGTIEVTSLDPITITAKVVNPENRCAQTLTIEAV